MVYEGNPWTIGMVDLVIAPGYMGHGFIESVAASSSSPVCRKMEYILVIDV
jgi:hypothetical protein